MPRELYRGALDEDLRPLSALLWAERIPHRVTEGAGTQLVLLADDADAERAATLLGRWQRGELRVELRPRRAGDAGGAAPAIVHQAPVTLALIALSVLGFLLVYLGPVSWVAALTYDPFVIERGRPVFGEADAQLWRLVTPAFLHFGWMHIAFNSLWCWELGRRIEESLGSLNLAGLFLVTAVTSNVTQHLVSGPVLFGGLSGVVYGLLAFAWVAGRLNPRWRTLAPATPIMLFMVGWLVVCLFGAFEVLGFSVANGAHVGGLVTGAAAGAVFALAHRDGGDGGRRL